MADLVTAASEAQRQRMVAPLGTGSWRVDVHSFGRHKPYSAARKVQLMELFAPLLWQLPGRVDLAAVKAPHRMRDSVSLTALACGRPSAPPTSPPPPSG